MEVVLENNRWGGLELRVDRTSERETLAHPRKLFLDYQVDSVDQEQTLAAASMLFPHVMEGNRVENLTVGEGVRTALAAYFGPRGLSLPVANGTDERALGSNTLLIPQNAGHRWPAQEREGGRRIVLQLLDSNQWAGRLFSMNEMVISTNFRGVAATGGYSAAQAAVAVGLILASDLRVRKIVVESSADSVGSPRRLQALCSAVGVELYFETDEGFERYFDENRS